MRVGRGRRAPRRPAHGHRADHADAEVARKVFRLIDALEDCDDVQNVFANIDVSDEVLAEIDA